MNMSTDNGLRITEVCQIVGLSKSSVYRLEKKGEFPSRRMFGIRAVRWMKSEVTEFMSTRPLLNTPESQK